MDIHNVLAFVEEFAGTLAACVALIAALIAFVKKSVKEKNWRKLIDLVISLACEAESKFDNGADRKEWVISMVKSMADQINYAISDTELGELIDSIVAMSKVVNAKVFITAASGKAVEV